MSARSPIARSEVPARITPDHAGARHAGDDLIDAERFQLLLHHRRGAEFLHRQLGMRVQVAAPLGHVGVEFGDPVDDGHSGLRGNSM